MIKNSLYKRKIVFIKTLKQCSVFEHMILCVFFIHFCDGPEGPKPSEDKLILSGFILNFSAIFMNIFFRGKF